MLLPLLPSPPRKAAVDAPHSRRFAQVEHVWQTRSVWTAFVLTPQVETCPLPQRVATVIPGRPTAFLVSRPNHVLTVMSHLLGRGLRFPPDATLISRDHDSFLDNMVPSVARYRANPAVFARTISNLVVEVVRDGIVNPKEHRMMAELVSGQTLG